jgi:hypothetical protein
VRTRRDTSPDAAAAAAPHDAAPIPNSPPFHSATLAVQGISSSLATTFGLASSNGVQVVSGF